MANNDANADNTGLIVNVKYDTNVPPHVITIPSPRVIAQYHLVLETIRAALTCIPQPTPHGLSALP